MCIGEGEGTRVGWQSFRALGKWHRKWVILNGMDSDLCDSETSSICASHPEEKPGGEVVSW